MMMEALLRQESCVLDSKQLHHAVAAIGTLLLMASPASLSACISLMSTICKHTAMSVKKMAEQGLLEMQGKAVEDGWGNAVRSGLQSLHAGLTFILQATLTCIDCGGGFCLGENHSICSNGSSSKITCNKALHRMYKEEGPCLASCSLPIPTQKCLSPDSQSRNEMDQLRAIIALTLTQFLHVIDWLGPNGEQGLRPEWWTELAPKLDTFLVLLLNAVIRSSEEVGESSIVTGGFWDLYAQKIYNGRLLAGCCHLECRSMSGCSEAALPTRLCGGCRKVRYCSIECQRAAWDNGMHCKTCAGADGFWERMLEGATQ